MQHTPASAVRVPSVLAADEGRHFHFLNHLATVKVTAGEDGSMSVVEFLAPKGFGPPLHRHNHEDEIFLILDGSLAFHTGDERVVAVEGATALLPKGIPHTFQVLSETARFVNVTASTAVIPEFDLMVAELGVVTDEPELPEPGYIDAARVADVCAAHGIDILGPPPPALDL